MRQGKVYYKLKLRKVGFRRMLKNKPQALKWIGKSFLSSEMKAQYKELLELRYRQLGLG